MYLKNEICMAFSNTDLLYCFTTFIAFTKPLNCVKNFILFKRLINISILKKKNNPKQIIPRHRKIAANLEKSPKSSICCDKNINPNPPKHKTMII